LRFGEIFNDRFIANLQEIVAVKEFRNLPSSSSSSETFVVRRLQTKQEQRCITLSVKTEAND